jgi:bloom syndrome protein
MEPYLKALKKHFGFDSLKPFQEKIMKHLDGDLLILSPTGSGKSMCFQLPAIASNGITIIISPLKSLIEDQITQLKQKNINVAFLNEDLNKKEKIELFKKLKHIDDYLLFYVTPEIIMDDKLILILKDLHKEGKLARMVIDEAHCVSTWGHDFRDSYLKLKLIKKYIPDIKITALTATATPIVKEDIINILELNDPHIEATGFFRSNLNLKIINRNDTILSNLRDLIQNNYLEQCGVIYCHSRRETERVSNYLENYFKVSHYHAGLNQNIRKLIQKKWLTGQIKIIVATIAFGMGIDKPDVRFVIHYNLPSSLEGYYQEIGRAGRDGKPSDCILYYAYQDRVFYDNLFKRNQTPDSSNSNFNYNVSMTNFDNV